MGLGALMNGDKKKNPTALLDFLNNIGQNGSNSDNKRVRLGGAQKTYSFCD